MMLPYNQGRYFPSVIDFRKLLTTDLLKFLRHLAGNEKQLGEAGFRLGKAYEEYGDSDAAIKVLEIFDWSIATVE